MRCVKGDLWDTYGRHDTVTCITTNGSITNAGLAVMGRGCAYEATFRTVGIKETLGTLLKRGNCPYFLDNGRILTFPVKHYWNEKASLELIKISAKTLEVLANTMWDKLFVLPRPGCGNGGLTWPVVIPVISFLPDNVLIIDRG